MVVNVFSNIIQIVVLSTCTNALLGVHSTLQLRQITVWISCAEEKWLELKVVVIKGEAITMK